jgi:UDP-glucose 4-epimerase
LRAEGHEVVVYDNLSKGHREAVPSDVVLLTGDIAERSKLDAALREHRPEAVLHFAASIEAGESMRTPEKYFRNNSAWNTYPSRSDDGKWCWQAYLLLDRRSLW